MNNTLEQLVAEVRDINNRIIEACKDNEKLKKVYKGYQIFLSPLYYNPKVLFLGINPGSGYYRKHKQLLQKFEPLSEQDTKYEPWKQIQYCLTKIGKKEFLDDIVKLNYYFFATYNFKELNLFFNFLSSELRTEILQKSDQWIKTLIKEISPKYIICGGSYVLNKFRNLFPYNQIEEKSKNNFVGKSNDIIVFTYKRRFSLMRNRKEFIRYLGKYILENKE